LQVREPVSDIGPEKKKNSVHGVIICLANILTNDGRTTPWEKLFGIGATFLFAVLMLIFKPK
jgi:hypothetical protein